jgi:hypothetical protein
MIPRKQDGPAAKCVGGRGRSRKRGPDEIEQQGAAAGLAAARRLPQSDCLDGLIRNRTHATVAISHASIVVPLLLSSGLALVLYPRLATSDLPFTVFALFSGVSMSVTAFPVLAQS